MLSGFAWMKTTLDAIPIGVLPFSLTRIAFPLRCVLSANISTAPVGKHLFGFDAELFKNFCSVAKPPLAVDAPSNVCADLYPQNDHLTKPWLKEKRPQRKKTSMNVVVIN